MKRTLTSLAILAVLAGAANAAGPVYINEVLPNGPGSDTGNEHFELRGPPNMALTGYYLIGVDGNGGTAPADWGDINQFFDLGAFSLGANGYLFAKQASSPFVVNDPQTTVIQNTGGTAWGTAAGSTVGHRGDGDTTALENGPVTYLLVHIGSGSPPTLTLDLDTDNNGILELPAGWTVADSVGTSDGTTATSTDLLYGAINFRAPYYGTGMDGTYYGGSAYGNVIDVPPPAYPTSGGTFHIARKGTSTGTNSTDWVGTVIEGAAASPLAFYSLTSSDASYTGMPLVDFVHGGENPGPAPLGELPYTPTINGTRFTTNTILTIGGPVGDVAVDPRDNTTILFNVEIAGGGIYRAYKVASGNWWVDSTPIVTGLDRPSGMVVQDDGTLWWVHPYDGELMRLKAPWSANTPERVIAEFGGTTADDDPIDLAFAPANWAGSPGQPGWLVIADRGSDGDANNALNLLDPATTELDQTNNTFLVSPSDSSLGYANLDAIGSLPQSGGLVTLTTDGYITIVNGIDAPRAIFGRGFTMTTGQALAVDPNTGRVWVADDGLDEVWSVDTSLTPTDDIKELSFPLKDPSQAFRQMNFHDPGMVFSTNGGFMVVSDTSIAGGGGRLIIFHSEAPAPFALSNFSITNVTQTGSGPKLEWSLAGPASFNLKYVVYRSTNVANKAGYAPIATVTTTDYTDTAAPAGGAFYYVLAKP
ncbi:MAG TPA: hypothetical protein P5205_21785 [Candidatus Paceibacterota bacterium]|nr:hypothetical protein [Verrucomicrobiota bacterium]HSA12994.1 hypothetical protein [Candidatus Paceibacterota bacterium]